MSSEKSLGASDWEEEDLLSHVDAAERLQAEIAAARLRNAQQLEQSRRAGDQHEESPGADEKRLTLMERRLVELEKRIQANAANDE